MPTAGLTDQETALLFGVPFKRAVNEADWPGDNEAEAGVTESELLLTASAVTLAVPGIKEMSALPVWLEFARLVAISVTTCGEETTAGAVYTPLATVPTCGETDQATPEALPLTIALNDADCPDETAVDAGDTITDALSGLKSK